MKYFPFLLLMICPLYSLSYDKGNATHIIENKGQVVDQYQNKRSDINFVIPLNASPVFIGSGSLHYQFIKPLTTGTAFKEDGNKVNSFEIFRLDVTLIGANKNAAFTVAGQLEYFEQYFTHLFPDGTIARSYSKVTYKDVYPNIDWVVYIKNGKLEYDFILKNGSRPSDIKIQYNGADKVELSNGDIRVSTPLGFVRESAPICLQEDGKRVASSFILKNNTIGFEVSAYNGNLIIDPVLEWGTYYGGVNSDYGNSVAHDINGNVYITGESFSINNIATVGSYQTTLGGGSASGFIAKFNSVGVRQWATYYGGSQGAIMYNIVSDDAGYIYVAGTTVSPDVIATIGSHQENIGSLGGYSEDIFLVKFDTAGVRQWGTYYGGDTTELTPSLAYDDNGYLYLTGETKSANNIATIGTYLPVSPGRNCSFIAKFDLQGIRQWGTYYDTLTDILIVGANSSGIVYVGGQTKNTLLATVGTHQENYGGGVYDAFIARFNDQGQRIWATYYGGTDIDGVEGLCIDANNNLYFGGSTNSTAGISTIGSHQPAHAGGIADGFLVKFNDQGIRVWGTYYGGPGSDNMGLGFDNGFVLDDTGNVFISGNTYSSTGIATAGSYQSSLGGTRDAFLVKFDSTGVRKWGTYYGGTGQELYTALDYAGDQIIYMVGSVAGTNGIATTGSHQENFGGGPWDGYLAKFLDCSPLDTISNIIGDNTICSGDTITYTVPALLDATNYLWTLPNGWTGSSTTNTITVVSGTTGGIVSVSGVNNCSVTIPDSLSVTVFPLPIPVITQNGMLLSTTSFTSYQWYRNDTLLLGETNQTYTITQDGDYFVIVTDANGCSDTSNIIQFALGVTSVESNTNLKLYPNPNNGTFTIEGNITSPSENTTIEVMDMYGRTLLKKNVVISNHLLKEKINIENTPSGIYILRMSNLSLRTVFIKQ